MEGKTKPRSLGNLTELDGIWEDWKRKGWSRKRMAKETERLIKEYSQRSIGEKKGKTKRIDNRNYQPVVTGYPCDISTPGF